jgi:hypothetical protein
MSSAYSLAKTYQEEIMKGYENANSKNETRMFELISQGENIILETSLAGPYSTHYVYQMSNGEICKIVTPSSLHWIPVQSVINTTD